MMEKKLLVSLSPHIHSSDSVRKKMWNVIIALVPALAAAIAVFGIPALEVMLLCTASAMLTEWLIEKFLMRRPCTLADGSAMITGLLLACNLPSILPWWMAVIGSVVAVGVGKMSFGGLGCNIWNPALVGRVFLLISFPAAMTTWPAGIGADVISGATSGADISTGATFLSSLNAHGGNLPSADILKLWLGDMNGSLGETASLALIAGLIWLLCTRTITWHIPASVIAGAALLSAALGGNPLLDILSGGLLLGAIFMATDYVTSPMTRTGQIIYGLMIGFITIIIRRFGSYPEGVSFAILLMNSFVPLINHYIKPRRFGERRKA